MKTIAVVAAIILNDQQQVLLAKRPDHLHQGGLWEFPGGKIEADETTEVALVRELEEELGIKAETFQLFTEVIHDYSDKSVHLSFWTVTAFNGEPEGREQQSIRWVPLSELSDYPFPAANEPVVQQLLTQMQQPQQA